MVIPKTVVSGGNVPHTSTRCSGDSSHRARETHTQTHDPNNHETLRPVLKVEGTRSRGADILSPFINPFRGS